MMSSSSPEVQDWPRSAADSTDLALVPASFKAAFLYADGKYVPTGQEAARFEWVAHISVTGNPLAAAYARVQDVERFDATPAEFPPFAAQRLSLGHSCGIAYADLSTITEKDGLLDQLAAESMLADRWLLWVAWWWGQDVPPSLAEVAGQLELMGRRVHPDRIAACQWKPGGPYDTSVLYQPHVMHRPQGWPS
jgi:hypothetical protein